ncbi:hypothetical protein Drorol1_Dr00001866 [Drosera rotundifolia]
MDNGYVEPRCIRQWRATPNVCWEEGSRCDSPYFICHVDSSFLVSSRANGYESSGKEPSRSDEDPLNDSLIKKLDHGVKDFLWLGSSWTCKKKRKHYQSLDHNGVKILVNDLVYVLGEEYKRLVAYLDDMYEDSRGNNMVVVRWFHKVDEVDTNLPHNYNDREIFFSLCLQDLNV